MRKKIEFVDAQQMKQIHPDTFEIPEPEDFKALKVGDMVKVCAYQERFWVEITAIEGEQISGKVANVLVTRFLKYNAPIEFETKHIYDILKKEQLGQSDRKSMEEMKQKILKNQGKAPRR